MNSKRFYVGNLNPSVTESDIEQLFSKFGKVSAVEVRAKNIEELSPKCFAFVDLEIDESAAPRIIKRLNCTKWKGQEITIQVAKESFMQRLQKEREETRAAMNISVKAAKSFPAKRTFNERNNQKQFTNLDIISEHKPVAKITKFHDVSDVTVEVGKKTENELAEQGGNTKAMPNEMKKVEDNERRLKSMMEKELQMKQQQTLIKDALTKGKQLNKRVVFDNIEAKNVKKKALFEDTDDTEEISIDTTFHDSLGKKKSEKLVELQSRFAHDPRFKIGEKFLEDLNEEKDEEEVAEDEETEHNIAMLESVLGKSISRRPKVSTKKKSMNNSLLIPRFDPSKLSDAEKYELKSKSSSSENKQNDNASEQTKEEEKCEVSKERYYEVSSSLKDIWKRKEDEPESTFSLSQVLGYNYEAEDGSETNEQLYKNESVTRQTVLESAKVNPIPSTFVVNNEKFFFDDNDSRFAEDSFFNQILGHKSGKDWNALKIAAIEVLARKRRFAKQKMKSEQSVVKLNSNDIKFKKFNGGRLKGSKQTRKKQ